jgi:HEAT repeat protein
MTESSNAQVALNAQQLDPADRIRAIWAIVATGDSGFVPELMQRLEDEDAAVRLFAKEALTRLADFTWDAPMLDPDLLSQAADQWDGYPIDAPPWRMISSHDFPAGATLNR